MTNFTHINKQGNAKMVDVSNKEITKRVAEAHSSIIVNEKFIVKLLKILIVKEMYLILQIAGIMALKTLLQSFLCVIHYHLQA